MIYFRTLLFVLSGLSLHQIAYTMFPFLKKRYQKTVSALVAGCSRNSALNVRCVDVFDYPEIFKGNYYKDGVWIFNSSKFNVDDDFLFSSANKWDYTPRVHFQHMEWLFQIDDPVGEYLGSCGYLSKSTFYWHPSPATQRFFVLLFLYLKYSRVELLQHIEDHALYIADNIEVNLHGNHFLDNYLALLAYSAITGNDDLYVFVRWQIKKHFVDKFRFFPEKTPCYCALLNARLQLLARIDTRLSEFKDLCMSIESLLLNNPPVHLNDSYLVRENWFRVYGGSRFSEGYFATHSTKDYMYTLVGDSFALRGFQAHSHDSSGSLFVHDASGRQIIGGLGTRYYAAGEYRNYLRSSDAYCQPLKSLVKIKKRYFFASFRNFGLDLTHYSLRKSDTAVLLDINSNGQIIIHSDELLIKTNRDFQFSFWSDISFEDILKYIQLKAGTLVSGIKDVRYDGIYNQKTAYRYVVQSHGGSVKMKFLINDD